MTTLSTAAGLALAIGLAAGVPQATAQGNMDGQKYDKGATVTLQGCVTAAEKKGTFVLTGLKEWPIAKSAISIHGRRIYWIDKDSKDLKNRVGHLIQVTGKITDVLSSEIELEPGENGGALRVEIEGPGRDVWTTAANVGVDASKLPNMDDIKTTVLKLKLDDLKMLSSTCSTTTIQ